MLYNLKHLKNIKNVQQNPEKVAHLENNMKNITELLNGKEILGLRIQQMIYGSIEIRESKGKDIFIRILEMKEYLLLNIPANIVLS